MFTNRSSGLAAPTCSSGSSTADHRVRGFGSEFASDLDWRTNIRSPFFAVALVASLLLTPERRHLTSSWLGLGGLIALLLALPNIVWQIQHGWPTWVLLQNIAHSHKNVVLTPGQFIGQLILLMNPATFPIWFGGLCWLLVSREGRRYRVLGFAYLIALAEFIIMHGKNYYLAPAYPMLFAAGGVAVERVFALRMEWLKPAFAAVMIGVAGLLTPLAIPILPPEQLVAYMRTIHLALPRTETSHTAALPQLFADQFGWEEMVRSVARVYDSLSPNEQNALRFFVKTTARLVRSIFLAQNTDCP